MNVRIYDNGGETLDRYTAVYLDIIEKSPDFFAARGMSEDPYTGIGQWCYAQDGDHLGKEISLDGLPPKARALVLSDLA